MVAGGITSRFNNITLVLRLIYLGNVVSSAAAPESVEVYEEENLLERSAEVRRYRESRVEIVK